MNINHQSEFVFILEKRGRGDRGRGSSYVLNWSNMLHPWSLRTFVLVKQSFNYYDKAALKGVLNVANCRAWIPSSSDDDYHIVSGKQFPFVLQLRGQEKVYLNAHSDYIRLQCMNILTRASTREDWNKEVDNRIAEIDIQLKLANQAHVLDQKLEVAKVFSAYGARCRFRKAKMESDAEGLQRAAVQMIVCLWRNRVLRLKLLSQKQSIHAMEDLKVHLRIREACKHVFGKSMKRFLLLVIASIVLVSIYPLIKNSLPAGMMQGLHYIESIWSVISHSILYRIQFMVEIAVVLSFSHRLIGYLAGRYLREILDPDRRGQYSFHFDWISLRVGFDQFNLVVHGLEWRNPSQQQAFRNTPYLLRVDEINVVLSSYSSLYSSIRRKTPIKIRQIRIEGLTLNIERSTAKGSEGLINLWAAMGATNASEESSALEYIDLKIASAVDGATNMVTVLQRLSSRMLLTGLMDTSRGFMHKLLRTYLPSAFFRNVQRDLHLHDDDDDDEWDDEIDITTARDSNVTRNLLNVHDLNRLRMAASASSSSSEDSKGFGICPFKFEIDHIHVNRVSVCANDLLNKKHVKANDMSVIKLKSFDMFRVDLLQKPTRSNGLTHPDGLYLDDVTWRFVNKGLAHLLMKNTLSLVVLVSTAAGNYTKYVLREVAKRTQIDKASSVKSM